MELEVAAILMGTNGHQAFSIPSDFAGVFFLVFPVGSQKIILLTFVESVAF